MRTAAPLLFFLLGGLLTFGALSTTSLLVPLGTPGAARIALPPAPAPVEADAMLAELEEDVQRVWRETEEDYYQNPDSPEFDEERFLAAASARAAVMAKLQRYQELSGR